MPLIPSSRKLFPVRLYPPVTQTVHHILFHWLSLSTFWSPELRVFQLTLPPPQSTRISNEGIRSPALSQKKKKNRFGPQMASQLSTKRNTMERRSFISMDPMENISITVCGDGGCGRFFFGFFSPGQGSVLVGGSWAFNY